MPIDALSREDCKILEALQENGRMTTAELAEVTNLSSSPCWRRVRRLEEAGVIRGYSADIDPRKVGLGVLVYISIRIEKHTEAEALRFEKTVAGLDEVVTCHSVAGGADFILQVVCSDLDAFAEFSMHTLRRIPGIKSMVTNFALKEIKANGCLPISTAAGVDPKL